MSSNQPIQKAVAFIKSKKVISPSIGIITGSGWDITGLSDITDEIPYEDIPDFPHPTVEGHTGKLISGRYKELDLVILQGRVHFYEGYDIGKVTFPVETLSGLGVKYVIITNSAGGINPGFRPGDIMVITDHINLMGINPLRNISVSEGRTRFVDMSEAYDRGLKNAALEFTGNAEVTVHCGVLAAMQGPSYETPAEIQMLRTLGADAVCMSTVPEVIMARYLGMKVLGLSVITNSAAGTEDTNLTHEEVLKTAASGSKDACGIITEVLDYVLNQNLRGQG